MRLITRIYSFNDPRQAHLYERRRAVGLLAHVVAAMAGITQPELSNIECGRKQATPEQIARLDVILTAYERAQSRILRASEARSLACAQA